MIQKISFILHAHFTWEICIRKIVLLFKVIIDFIGRNHKQITKFLTCPISRHFDANNFIMAEIIGFDHGLDNRINL